ncbi:flippase [Priestia aryabhattai]|uniref:flippase n=1 Tax=Priestia aryabhattai TaxID=412384 RepID=UPI0025A3838C|nr:flippase [Priestia aryabhattai]WJN45978.1 flippase [Priestia aryabhattai]
MKRIFNNRLFGNIFSLLILQGSNYIFPLVTFPYLVRKLGTNNYGVLVVCIATMQFLNIFVDYGFNISGTREISINKKIKEKVNEIYNIIMTLKIIFTLILGIIYFICIETFSVFHDNKLAYLLSYLILVGNTLFPIWLYQGLEKMKYITYINILVKLMVTMLIFIFIKDKGDINIAVFFQTLYYIVPGIISLLFVKFKFKLEYKFVYDVIQLKEEVLKGKFVFLTSLWINFYSQGPLIILGFISGNNAAGNYGIGQKIMGAFYGLSQPIVQAIYPYICEMYDNSKEKFYKFQKNFLFLSLFFSILISVSLFLLSPHLVVFISGASNANLTLLVKLFSLVVSLSIMNTVMARLMYAVNLQKVLNNSYSIAATVFIVLAIPLTFWFQEFGMASVVIVAETIIFILNAKNIKNIEYKS